MDYQEIKDLIDFTLQGKESRHEITPLEHQNMIMAVLEYAHSVEVTGQSVLQGFATSSTVPATPDNAKLCYIALCPKNITTTFSAFDGSDGQPISVTCASNEVKFVALLWNTKYWEKNEQSFEISNIIDGGNAYGII